ncbi:MAG: hypothetical protein JST17_03265 [Bacteroidetes bacterium]|nr:hypothetical protein [Bacteroidota bacterium]MBS1932315.1 hypothetical protein [Bacteroidota bacterium]
MNRVLRYKELLISLLMTVWICACQTGGSNNQQIADSQTIHQDSHEKPSAVLTLNNGAKWKADSTSFMHVEDLKSIAEKALKTDPVNFKDIASQLQESINRLINDCKMKGPDHEALHWWLEPLLEKVKLLKDATSSQGTVQLKEISAHLNLFKNYFD